MVQWVTRPVIIQLHDLAIQKYGGLPGLRDSGLLDSALARPQMLHSYRPDLPISLLAAVYAGGILRNHPFIDGNKRTGALLIRAFLLLNGSDFRPQPGKFAQAIESAAAGTLTEEELADRIGEWTEPLRP